MTPERHGQIVKLYHSLLEINAAERSIFLAQTCGDDEALRHELESLLASHLQAESFLESPAIEIAAQILADDRQRDMVGCSLGHYEIKALLGAGGMGEVYLAQDTKLDREVALKLLPAEVAANPDRMRRFTCEAKAASALNHPNIITIHEIGQSDSGEFIVTEFIDGRTLRQQMQTAPMQLDEVLDISTQVARALLAAHAAGIVHRDIKPENLMLRGDGIVKVLDFGIAKLTEELPSNSTSSTARSFINTEPDRIMGTASYMSPEQARGTPVDARSDVFSLGVVIYEMVTGCLPFVDSTSTEVLASVQSHQQSASPGHVPAEFERIISKALRRNRNERYQTIKAMLTDLTDFVRQHEVNEDVAPTRSEETLRNRPSSFGQLKARPGNQRIGVLILVTILVAVTLGIALLLRADGVNKPENIGNVNRTLAVLPFNLLGEDAGTEQNDLSLGLADSLITRLSNVSSLTVRPTSAVLKYGSQSNDIIAAAHDLKVDAVLAGSVQRSSGHIRVTVQLVRTADGKTVWADTYDTEFKGVFQVQDEVSMRVAEALQIRLTTEERERLGKHPTGDLEAYQLYLRGNYHLYKFTPEDLQTAMRHFNEAIARDPAYALAYAGLANSYGIAASFGDDDSSRRAEAAATKAVEIDPTLPEAHAALAAMKFWQKRDVRGAQDSFNRALDLNPNSAVVHHYYAWFLTATARFVEGQKHMRRALELDPLSVGINVDQGLPLFYARRYQEARTLYVKALDLDPNYIYAYARLGESSEELGDLSRAVSEFQRALTLSKGQAILKAQLARALALAGRRGEARRLLREVTRQGQPRVSPYYLALAYLALDEREQAFAFLKRALVEQDKWFAWINIDPRLDLLRSDPRFADLIRGFKLLGAE